MSQKTSRLFGRLSVSLLAGALATTAAVAESRAEQFVLFDVMYTYTQDNAVNAKPSKSHFYVRSQMNPMRPKDWTAPVDYRNGTVHVRTEVIDKPAGSVAMAWTLCYIPYKGTGAGYGCTNTSTYTEEGIFDRDVGMTTWWQNNLITWNQGIQGMDLVLKDDKGVFSHARPDPEHFFPTTVRITMIQVSAGAKYDPSLVPNLAPSDGGASPAPAPDAGVSGTGGTGGSAGAGSGGASGATASGGNSGAAGATTTTGTGGTPAAEGGRSGSSAGSGGSSGSAAGSTGTGGTSAGAAGGSTGGSAPPTGSKAAGGVAGGCSLGTSSSSGSGGLAVGLFGLLFALTARRRRR